MSAPLHGVVAEYGDARALLAAAERAREDGWRALDAYAPERVPGLGEAVGVHGTRVPLAGLIGGILGGVAGYLVQWWTAVRTMPLDVAGRPDHSWPSFVPVTFETTVLGAGLATWLGMLAMNGMPALHHPLFDVPGFERASQDRFFLCIAARDPAFDPAAARQCLERTGAIAVREVPA